MSNCGSSAKEHDILEKFGTSLFLALNSPNAETRKQAVIVLREHRYEDQTEFVASSLKERLIDEDMEVAVEANATLKVI